MEAVLLIGVGLGFGLAALAVPSNRWRPWLVPAGATLHLALTLRALADGAAPVPGAWVGLDPCGRLVLGVVSLLFWVCSWYTVGYLAHRRGRLNRVFCACLLGFLGMATLVAFSQHFGLQWVAMEATTLITAPLIYFNRTPRSIEATWKYLLLCSVGIALALLGSFFLAYAALRGGLAPSLVLGDLVAAAPRLSVPWLRGAFTLLLVGYGTKMGLAPMHSWKPDAYGEAPGVVGALFAGGMTSCAFLTIVRAYQVMGAAGLGTDARRQFLALGLLSVAAAAVFLVRQRDLKRMLAYSSVEHMGILVIGLGLGGGATFGALFHMVNNALVKGLLFLAVGNLHRAFATKSLDGVAGAWRRLPLTGWLFAGGMFAVTGSPPFGPFRSLFQILRGGLEQGHTAVVGTLAALLLVVFLGMGAAVLAAVQGPPSPAARATDYRDGFLTGAPLVVFFALVCLLGVWLPQATQHLLESGAETLLGR
ncbi:MAG: proton-conducting transporter membrane subunit [Deferrisomatales bacterium]|nr:proton-conducting transporter membrane subunit [Deferrisomatales bacterium]